MHDSRTLVHPPSIVIGAAEPGKLTTHLTEHGDARSDLLRPPSAAKYSVVDFMAHRTGVRSLGSQHPYTLVYDGRVACAPGWRGWRLPGMRSGTSTWCRLRRPESPRGSHGYHYAHDEAIQLVGPGGETWQGSAAIEKLLDILPRGRWIAWIFHVPFVRRLADRLYRWVARNRFCLGCGEHCQARQLDVFFRETDVRAKV